MEDSYEMSTYEIPPQFIPNFWQNNRRMLKEDDIIPHKVYQGGPICSIASLHQKQMYFSCETVVDDGGNPCELEKTVQSNSYIIIIYW